MNWKHTLIIVISILILGIILGRMMNINHTENKKIQELIIENERKIIDSLQKEITSQRLEREKIENNLEILNRDIKNSENNLTSRINQLKIQNNVKIESIINSTNGVPTTIR